MLQLIRESFYKFIYFNTNLTFTHMLVSKMLMFTCLSVIKKEHFLYMIYLHKKYYSTALNLYEVLDFKNYNTYT